MFKIGIFRPEQWSKVLKIDKKCFKIGIYRLKQQSKVLKAKKNALKKGSKDANSSQKC